MKVEMMNGIPVVTYNSVVAENGSKISFGGKTYDGFYVSFNGHDSDIYGDVTTALVLGQAEKNFILNGDHTEAYRNLAKSGFGPCMEYFRRNAGQANRFSDRLPHLSRSGSGTGHRGKEDAK